MNYKINNLFYKIYCLVYINIKFLRMILKDKIPAIFMNRTLHNLFIEIILILILLGVYYRGGIENDRSMSICLLGTYIIGKWFLNAIHMKLHPFKCGLQLCV